MICEKKLGVRPAILIEGKMGRKDGCQKERSVSGLRFCDIGQVKFLDLCFSVGEFAIGFEFIAGGSAASSKHPIKMFI